MKKWEMTGKNGQKITLNESELSEKMSTADVSAGFYSNLKNLKVGESMFHYDMMAEFKRIE